MALTVGNVFSGVKYTFKGEILGDGSWQVTAASLAGGAAIVYTGATLGNALAAATLAVTVASGPLVGVAVAVTGGFLVANVTSLAAEAAYGASYNFFTSESYQEFAELLEQNESIESLLDDLRALHELFISNPLAEVGEALKQLHAVLDEVTDGVKGAVGDAIDFLKDEFGLGLSSPIVLDLDGDGLEYVTRTNSDVFFDIDHDGFAEHVQWMKGDDGFLVRDLNGNGKIDSVAEMFGDNGGTSAYSKLDAIDTDNPSGNVLNSSDTAWSTLRVWQDANENGQVDI